jgi:spoIIIJ-associated protein
MKRLSQHTLETLLDGIIKSAHLDLTYAIKTHPGSVPDLTAEFFGPDTSFLIARNGEVLRAIEHLAFEMLGLDASEHDLIAVDADHYTSNRNAALATQAQRAAAIVLETGRPYVFEPMSSHERRRLHLALTLSGLRSTSTGEGSRRAVVLYPDRTIVT